MRKMRSYFKDKNLIKSDHHLNRYLKFISNYIKSPKVKGYTEEHHILPRVYFPEHMKNKKFRVNLPLRAHFIAHQMLALAIGGKMWSAFQLMGRIKKHSSRHYKIFKEQALIYNNDAVKVKKISNTVAKLWADPNYRKIQEESRTYPPLSSEHKKKLSLINKGKKKPEGFRVGLKHSNQTKKKLSECKKGMNNPSIKPVTIYDNNNVPFVTILFKFLEVCRELNLPTSLEETYKNNTKLYMQTIRNCDISRLTSEGKYKFKGWYARYTKINKGKE